MLQCSKVSWSAPRVVSSWSAAGGSAELHQEHPDHTSAVPVLLHLTSGLAIATATEPDECALIVGQDRKLGRSGQSCFGSLEKAASHTLPLGRGLDEDVRD